MPYSFDKNERTSRLTPEEEFLRFLMVIIKKIFFYLPWILAFLSIWYWRDEAYHYYSQNILTIEDKLSQNHYELIFRISHLLVWIIPSTFMILSHRKKASLHQKWLYLAISLSSIMLCMLIFDKVVIDPINASQEPIRCGVGHVFSLRHFTQFTCRGLLIWINVFSIFMLFNKTMSKKMRASIFLISSTAWLF